MLDPEATQDVALRLLEDSRPRNQMIHHGQSFGLGRIAFPEAEQRLGDDQRFFLSLPGHSHMAADLHVKHVNRSGNTNQTRGGSVRQSV